MDQENGEGHVATSEEIEGEVEGPSSPSSQSFWEEADQEERERQAREHEKQGKITSGELPQSGSARKAKEMFESQPEQVESHAPVDLEILSGMTKATMKNYQEKTSSEYSEHHREKQLDDLPEAGITSATRQQLAEAARRSNESKRDTDDLEEVRGIASSHKAAFESGTVSNVERKKGNEEQDGLPVSGIASKTRQSIESGQVIHAENRYVRETDGDMPSAGAASAARRRFENKSNSEEKAERRLSYQPEKGEAKSRAAMYMQSVETSRQKNALQDEEDALPPAGKAQDVRKLFEQDKVVHAESNRQDLWKEDLPASGAAQASKEALKAAASKGYERTNVEDEALSPGKASATRNLYEKGEFEHKKIEKEEPVVAPGSAKEQMKHYQEAVEDQGVRRRTMDNEQEELQAARGVALSVRESYEKEGAPHIETKKTIADEDFTGIEGQAKKTTKEIEEGGLIKETPKMVETEDFSVTQGMAKQTTQQIEKGELIKETPKMVDEEDFSTVEGLAKQTTEQIEKGELIKEAPKMVEDEDFSGISGVVQETRSRIDSGEFGEDTPVSNEGKEDLTGIESVSSTQEELE